MERKGKPSAEQLDAWRKDPNNWKFGMFYYNPEDERLFPPKRFKALGWTINFANRRSLLTIPFIAAIIITVMYFSS